MGDRMTHMTVPIQRSDFGFLETIISDRQRTEALLIAETERVKARHVLEAAHCEPTIFDMLGLER
jgi:hypothetical protein